jgi:hypothetical protein
MPAKKIKEILAVINIAGLLAGGGMMLGGCSGDKSKDVPASESLQKESKKSVLEGDLNKDTDELGPATGKKIRGKSG